MYTHNESFNTNCKAKNVSVVTHIVAILVNLQVSFKHAKYIVVISVGTHVIMKDGLKHETF